MHEIMTIFRSDIKTPLRYFKEWLKFRIRQNFYQEILNTRGFGADDLWGSIGGYVGIFCGYSILQGATYFIQKFQEMITNLL